MTEFDPNNIDQHSPGAKLDSGKPDVDLVFSGFPRALLAVAEVATFGAKKYTPGGWRHVDNGVRRYTSAMDRHRLYGAFETRDPDSGLLHAAHEAWNALARLELMLSRDVNANKPKSGLHELIEEADALGLTMYEA